jgi:hypothetical protein
MYLNYQLCKREKGLRVRFVMIVIADGKGAADILFKCSLSESWQLLC